MVVPVALQCSTGTDLAKRFKIQHPKNAESYGAAVEEGQMQVGRLWYYSPNKSRKGFINMPVKDHWRSKADLDIIKASIKKLAEWVSVDTVAFSQEGLDPDVDWEDVKKIIHSEFSNKNIEIELWETQ